jgi:hypothetical protein
LPQSIERLEKRIADLTQDMATVSANDSFLVGGKTVVESALARVLNAIPENVDRQRRYPLGMYHGLAFGIERHPGGTTDVYLEGKTFRKSMLSRDAQGPRAVNQRPEPSGRILR